MTMDECKHFWTITNVRDGFIVEEKCFHCQQIITYFSYEDIPPKEQYREGDHFWNYSGSAQSARFDLKCGKCDQVVEYEELMGLMYCASCTQECDLNIISRICESQKIWVYAALSHSSPEKEIRLPLDKIRILTDYFNQQIRTPGKKILVVPGWLRKNPEKCLGEVLKDVGMLILEPGRCNVLKF